MKKKYKTFLQNFGENPKEEINKDSDISETNDSNKSEFDSLIKQINESNLNASKALELSNTILKKFDEQQKQYKILLDKIENSKNNNKEMSIDDFIK